MFDKIKHMALITAGHAFKMAGVSRSRKSWKACQKERFCCTGFPAKLPTGQLPELIELLVVDSFYFQKLTLKLCNFLLQPVKLILTCSRVQHIGTLSSFMNG